MERQGAAVHCLAPCFWANPARGEPIPPCRLTWSLISSRSSVRTWLKRVSWVTSALVCSPARSRKDKVSPRTDAASRGCGLGTALPPQHRTGRARQPTALPPPPWSRQDPFPCSTSCATPGPCSTGGTGTGCRGSLTAAIPRTPGKGGSGAGTYPGWMPARLLLQGER